MKPGRRGAIIAAVLCMACMHAGCGWVYPETKDPKAVLEYEADAMSSPAPPEADFVADTHPGAREQALSPAARLLAHDVRFRLENRTLGYPGGTGFEVTEIFISALDVEEYAAAKERFAAPAQAGAVFMPGTEENQERYYRQSMGSAITLRFQPGGSSTQTLGKNNPFWTVAADRNAIGLLVIANMPNNRTAIRMLSIEKGAWPGRRIDLLLTASGLNVLSTQRK